jgi:hypothetical protein
VSPSQGIFSIGQNVMYEIASHANLVDNKTCKISDIDVEFIATNATAKIDSKLNPERSLVRYEFMEIFVRIALHKFYRSKVADS